MKRFSISEAKARFGAVLVSSNEYEAWKETIAILSDRHLMREIRASLVALRAGKSRLYTVQELFK